MADSKKNSEKPADSSAADVIEADLPSLQELQQQVLNSNTVRTRTLIIYAVAAAILLGLAKKVIIPPFNTVVDIDTEKFTIMVLIMLTTALYLIWELWNGVSHSVTTWRENRDLAYQRFRHVSLDRIPSLEDRVTEKFNDRIRKTESRIRAELLEDRNRIQSRLDRLDDELNALTSESAGMDVQLHRKGKNHNSSDKDSTYSHRSDVNTSGHVREQSNPESVTSVMTEQVQARINEVVSRQDNLIKDREAIEQQLKADKAIADDARLTSINELDSIFTLSVDELVEDLRFQQMNEKGTASQYSLMLGVQQKNRDFERLRKNESLTIREKASTPKYLSTSMLVASLCIPAWTLSDDYFCENGSESDFCLEDPPQYGMEEAVKELSVIVDGVLDKASLMHEQRTTVLSALIGSSRPQPPTTADSTRPVFAFGGPASLLRLSFPVFPLNQDELLASESTWMKNSASNLLNALESCEGPTWLHVVAYADSKLYTAPYPACGELQEGGSVEPEKSRNLCLANRRAKSVARVFTELASAENFTTRVTVKEWQGVQCATEGCYSEYDMMLHQAGISDPDAENAGVLNRRADVHVMSAGNCDLQTVVSGL